MPEIHFLTAIRLIFLTSKICHKLQLTLIMSFQAKDSVKQYLFFKLIMVVLIHSTSISILTCLFKSSFETL